MQIGRHANEAKHLKVTWRSFTTFSMTNHQIRITQMVQCSHKRLTAGFHHWLFGLHKLHREVATYLQAPGFVFAVSKTSCKLSESLPPARHSVRWSLEYDLGKIWTISTEVYKW